MSNEGTKGIETFYRVKCRSCGIGEAVERGFVWRRTMSALGIKIQNKEVAATYLKEERHWRSHWQSGEWECFNCWQKQDQEKRKETGGG